MVGLGTVFVLTLVALGTLPDDQKSTVVTASFSVLGTIVGAYFGVRVAPFPKPRTSFDHDLEVELAALRAHKRKREIPSRGRDRLLLATWNIAKLGSSAARTTTA